ncbi:hypothetical protein B8V81_2532 [Paenibacillus pasadenensis]|uniref:Copper amine oxidase-like N-terminal domain-containing protein n=1 Tax=Paenibacillus pasadenensis TaxID=217090 RepID=A0A2N5N185_9BACL|nr:stalk domain-containing protein [Paenibacillus pasadenensis]PLT44101.1 hypothetical protein B8V81_2532 [Paenibacillus pasadenensis]
MKRWTWLAVAAVAFLLALAAPGQAGAEETAGALRFTIEKKELVVGEKTPVQIQAPDGYGQIRKVPLAEADVVIEKPYLLQKLPDGTMKALAVGETDVTASWGEEKLTLRVSISADYYIGGGVQLKGVMYLPIKAFFAELGAQVTYLDASKTFQVKLGNDSIQLQKGSATAVVNGAKTAMAGPVQTYGDAAVFPASLLRSAIGANLEWNSDYQYMTVWQGKADLAISTPQTEQIVKKEKLGTLTKLIGKSYWVNNFDSKYRFKKVAIYDIRPDDDGGFTVVFKLASTGELLHTAFTSAEAIRSNLASSDQFLTADPRKTYKWSNAVWDKIASGKISIGMTKEQVKMSWGSPSHTSSAYAGSISVETWRYGSYTSNWLQYVVFTNGKVSQIYS